MTPDTIKAQQRRSRDRYIEFLLMAIIRANPHHASIVTDAARLQAAREALLGEKPSAGRTEMYDELEVFHVVAEIRKGESDWLGRALLHVQPAEGRAALQAEIDREGDSARKAALKQARKLLGPDHNQEEHVADRLRNKAREAGFTSHDMADLEGLANGDSPKVKMIRHAIEALHALGIAAEDPWSDDPSQPG